MLNLSVCNRDNLCVDCDSKTCLSAGDIGADCPKWKCDNPNGSDCEDCAFIKEFVGEMRGRKNER